MNLPAPLSEKQALRRLKQVMGRNKVVRSFIGLGFHDTFTPPVIQRNIFENPAGIFAHAVSGGDRARAASRPAELPDDDLRLTGLDVANASLLDELRTAAPRP